MSPLEKEVLSLAHAGMQSPSWPRWGVGGSEQGPASRAASSGHPGGVAGAGFFRGSECGEAFGGPRRSHEAVVLGRWSGPGAGGGRQALAAPCTCPCSASPPKAFANLPLNILPSRDHSKCHFWLGNQLHRVTGPVAFPPQQEQEARSRKPAGLESCRPGGQCSVSVTA